MDRALAVRSARKARASRGADLGRPGFADFAALQIRDVEQVAGQYRRNTDALEMLQRIHGTALQCATINSIVMTMAPMRLYRAASGTESKRARKISAKRHAHLRSRAVGAKAAMYAEYAGDVVEVTSHPVLEMLKRPNPVQTGTEWTVERFRHKQLFGNSVGMWIVDSHGPLGMVNLMPQYVSVIPDDDELVAGYWYGRDRNSLERIDTSLVMHLKWCPAIDNPYWGEGPLAQVIREMDLQEYGLAAEISRWRRGGFIGGHLSLEGANTDQIKQARESFRRQHGGPDKAGELFITSKGVYSQFANAHEMEYLSGMEYTDRRVEQAFGVPESLRRLNSANLASSLTGHRQYIELTIDPALAMDAEQLTERLLPAFGIEPGDMWFAYDSLSREDEDKQVLNAKGRTGGALTTINEERAEMGLDPSDNPLADKLLFNGTPLEKMGEHPPAPNFSLSPNITVPQTFVGGKDIEGEHEPWSYSIKSWGDADFYAAPCCHIETKDDDDFLAAHADVVDQLRLAVNEWLIGVADRITDDVVRDPSRFSLTDSQQNLADAIEPYVRRLFSVGAADGFAVLGDAEDLFSINPDRASGYLDTPMSLLIDSVTETTAEGIRAAVQSGIDAGSPVAEITQGVRAAMLDAAPSRAETIARTESAAAYGAGSRAAWKESGIEARQWLLAPNACSVCQAMVDGIGSEGRASKGVPIDEPFAKAGTVITGADGKSFTVWRDVWSEPLHPNDRCTTIPVVE